jgi:TetR/AcrR family transcriptional regulator
VPRQPPSAPPASRRERAEQGRRRLIDAGLREFAAVGFEAASTRSIAAAAGMHQPQIHYYFGSKLGLWEAAMHSLFVELDRSTSDIAPGEPHEVLAELCRRFVHFAARHPELNRIMVHESTADSARLDWLVTTHVRARFQHLARLVEQLDPESVPSVDPVIVWYCMVGASSLLAVNAPEGRRLIGKDPVRDRVVTHADAVAAMVLGPNPRSRPAATGRGSRSRTG